MPQEITNLIIKIQNGDQAAFAELYDQYAGRIYKYIRSRISDPRSSEDILQEVFLKVWRGCQGLDINQLNFSAWIYKITHNTINDYYRKQYRSPDIVELDHSTDAKAPNNVVQEIADKLTSEKIKKAIEELPANYRQVIELRFYQQFSIEETANIMNKNGLSIRVLQYRAIQKLKSIAKRYE